MVGSAACTRADIEQALRRQVPVIMSPSGNCYLDVPYAEQSAASARPGSLRLRSEPNARLARPWSPFSAKSADAPTDPCTLRMATVS